MQYENSHHYLKSTPKLLFLWVNPKEPSLIPIVARPNTKPRCNPVWSVAPTERETRRHDATRRVEVVKQGGGETASGSSLQYAHAGSEPDLRCKEIFKRNKAMIRLEIEEGASY